ncbi:MAG: poly-gamma-glutamate hydrolase family protein [Candidatus Obscuribacterales bacterium]|nr:poly-gamma-glutamate hydrolase family protein [Candidatus Obscuribacterales bacterium]
MSQDKYQSLAALKAALQDKIDFRVRLLDRRSKITVISPHGGFIEAGTSAIAREVAGRSYNLYDFQGLRKTLPAELHVTSTRFRDQPLSALLKNSQFALSLHCMGDSGTDIIWLGGLNKQFKALVLEDLQSAGFVVNPDSPMYRGESPVNIVNLPQLQGVQLELSEELLSGMFHGPRFLENGRAPQGNVRFDALVNSLRKSIAAYRKLLRKNRSSRVRE